MASNQDTYNKLRAQEEAYKIKYADALGTLFGDSHAKAVAGLTAIRDKIDALKPSTVGDLQLKQAQVTIARQEKIANGAKSIADPVFINAIAAIKKAKVIVDKHDAEQGSATTLEQGFKTYEAQTREASDKAAKDRQAKIDEAKANTSAAAKAVADVKKSAINDALGRPNTPATTPTPTGPIQGPGIGANAAADAAAQKNDTQPSASALPDGTASTSSPTGSSSGTPASSSVSSGAKVDTTGMSPAEAKAAQAKANATAKVELTWAQVLDRLKTDQPWLYKTYTSPDFTPAMQKVVLQWGRESAAGYPPTAQQVNAQTYNWPMTQLWSQNQATLFQDSFNHPGEYKAKLATATTSIDDLIKQKGLTVDAATRDKAINETFLQGWAPTDSRVLDLLTSKGTVDTSNTSGQATTALDQIKATAANYAIPLPTDPAKLDAFIKGAIGSNPDPNAFTEWAKTMAKQSYSFMSGAIDQGATVKGYLQPYATQIANTLDLAPGAINWQDPKWQSLLTTPDPAKPGVKNLASLSDIMRTIKTQPQYGYDNSQAGIADANNFGENLKSMFGF